MTNFKDTTILYTLENNIDPEGMSRRAGKTDTIRLNSQPRGKTEALADAEKAIENAMKFRELPRLERGEWQDQTWSNFQRMSLSDRVYIESVAYSSASARYERAVGNTPPGQCMVHDQRRKEVAFEMACTFCQARQKDNPDWICYFLDERMCARLMPSARQITCTCGSKAKMTEIFHSGKLNILGRFEAMEETWAPRIEDVDDDDRTPSPPKCVLEEVD